MQHPGAPGVNADAHDLHGPGLELDDEQRADLAQLYAEEVAGDGVDAPAPPA